MSDNVMLFAAIIVVAAMAGFTVGYVLSQRASRSRLREASSLGESIISEAQREAEHLRRDIEKKGKERVLELSREFERDSAERESDVAARTEALASRELDLQRKLDVLDRKEATLGEKTHALEVKQKVVEERGAELSRLIAEQNVKLERIAGMRLEDAQRQLIRNLEDEAQLEASRRARELREQAEEDSKREAQKIIALAIQRYAAEQSVETSVSVVDLPSDDMKGRIIGREGRNIRAFEVATGADVIIDDTPGAVIVSSFDPVRREIARASLETLVQDGRIHPSRIEEVVTRTTEDVEMKIREAGEGACMDLSLARMDPELVRLVGRMRFRTSYGQNCLHHSKEVAFLAGMIASELNLDPQIARRAGLLHDLGKVVSHETEGSHTQIGADIARRHGEGPEVVNAIHAHHGDVEATSLYTPIVAAADAISGARPGARRESLESYVKRLAKLEEIADGFDGVEKSYAIQAGREVRIIVSNRKVDDEGAAQLAYDISRRFEKDLEFPGQIKVVVIRETRAIDFAK